MSFSETKQRMLNLNELPQTFPLSSRNAISTKGQPCPTAIGGKPGVSLDTVSSDHLIRCEDAVGSVKWACCQVF